MFKRIAPVALACGVLGFAVACPARAQDNNPNVEEVVSRVRVTAAIGYNSSGAINALTFRDGRAHTGWSWELNAAYPIQRPFFVEAGLMGWRLGRDIGDDAKKFGPSASVGLQLSGGANEAGLGLVPGGGRVFFRHFFDPATPGKGPMGQLGIVFPSASGTRSFVDLSLGYGF